MNVNYNCFLEGTFQARDVKYEIAVSFFSNFREMLDAYKLFKIASKESADVLHIPNRSKLKNTENTQVIKHVMFDSFLKFRYFELEPLAANLSKIRPDMDQEKRNEKVIKFVSVYYGKQVSTDRVGLDRRPIYVRCTYTSSVGRFIVMLSWVLLPYFK